jgi:Colicin V production protein.
MWFDLIVIIIGLIVAFGGYRKGLVTTVLSFAAIAVSAIIAIYISANWTFLNIEYFGNGLQTLIIFVVTSLALRALISFIDVEEWLVIGPISRIFGAILFFLIYLFVLFIIVSLYVISDVDILPTYTDGSIIIRYIGEIIEKLITGNQDTLMLLL